MDDKPIFSTNDIGNKFLWLGYLLSQLDGAYKNTAQIFLKPNDAHKDKVDEIIDWQNQLMLTLSSSQSKSRLLGDFFKHKLPAIPNNEQIRVICVVFFRQTFMHLRDTLGMPLARIASPHRTINDILCHRNAVEQLFYADLLLQEKEGGCRYLDLHEGLGDFLLGNAVAPVDKPKINKEEPKLLPDKPPDIASHLGKPRAELSLPNYIKTLPQMNPKEMAKIIKKEGYIGQDQAVKSLCLLAWRHLNRLKKVFVDGVDYKNLPPKTNALLLGCTGCGKSFLVELLFSKIISLPVVIVDASNLVETGYVGAHVSSIFTKLIQVAGNNEKAALGIIFLDEFDKLCASHSVVKYAGQGTSKDLKYGAQSELLKYFEAFEVSIPLKLGVDDKMITLNTRNIPMICCGAFSGMKSMLQKQGKAIGFGAKDGKNSQTDFKNEIQRASSFESYGIIPELFGRFSSLIAFDDLTRDELKMILERNTIQQYEKELALNGLELEVYHDVFDHIVEQCMARGTGARGLQTALVSHLEEALFEAYSTPSQGIRLFVDGKQVGWEIQKRRVKRELKTKEAEKETLLLASG